MTSDPQPKLTGTSNPAEVTEDFVRVGSENSATEKFQGEPPKRVTQRIHPDLGSGWEPVPGYRPETFLGRGGFGEVWRTVGPGGVTLALKLIRVEAGLSDGEIRALDLLKNIHHPHLIGISGVWKTDELLVIAMELADETLLDAFDAAISQGMGGIAHDPLLEYCWEAAKGIDHLNGLGIVHRDIKPQNLLLMSGGVKVADFGLARLIQRPHDQSRISLTPSYAAPELCRGEAGNATDQYALAVSYCLLRGGRLPFNGNYWEVINGHLSAEPDLEMVEPHERPIVARALSKEPSDRWPDCRSFVQALSTAAVSPALTSAWTAAPPVTEVSRRGFAIAVASSGFVAASVAAMSFWPRPARRDPLETIRRNEILREIRFIRRTPLGPFRSSQANTVEVDQIEPDENPAFEIFSDDRVADLRGWRDVPDDRSDELISAVTQIRHVWLKKVRPAETLRFPGRTTGSALSMRCLSRYPAHEVALRSSRFVGNDRMKVRELVIDVSAIDVGEDFTVQVASTYWNSLQTPEELWLGVIGYGSISKISQLILFPDGKPFRSYSLKTTRAARDNPVTYKGPRSVLVGEGRDWINWDIDGPEQGLVYQIRWTW